MSKGIYHSSMKIRVLFILLLLFVFSSFTEKLMAREAEDNKTVTLTVNYNEERGIIKVNDTYVKNGEQLSIEYLSTVKITVIPNDGYCCSGSSLGITPKRIITHVVVYDASHYNTRPMMFIFENFVEDMIFDFLFFKLYNANIEVGGDEAFNENNQVIIDGKIIRQGKQEVALRYIRGIKIEFVERVGFYLKRVLIDGVDKTSEVSENELELYDPPKNVIVEYAKILSIFMSYNEGGTVKLNDQSIASGNSILVDASTDVRVAIMPDEGYHLKLVMLGITDVTDQVLNNILMISAVSENKEIMVTFEKDISETHAVKVTYSENKGRVEVNGNFVASGNAYVTNASTDVRVMIIPHIGARLERVILDDEDVTEKLVDHVLTIQSISIDKEIKVTFVAITYTLTITYSEGGAVLVDDHFWINQEFASGQSAIFQAVDLVDVWIKPQIDYRVKQVMLGSTDVTDKISGRYGGNLSLRFASSDIETVEDQKIEIMFEKITYVVKVTYSEGGSVQVNGQSVASGNACTADIFTDVKVMMIPDKGYRLREVNFGLMDVMNQVNNNVLTIPSISENKEITITFAYILKVYSSGNGSIKVNGEIIQSGSIIPDAGTKVEFVPNEGYYTAKVMLNSKDITSELVGNSFTVSTLPLNSSLSVTFKTLPTYELNIDMPKNLASIKIGDKVITESTRISDIKEGGSISINFQSNDYYEVKKVTLGDDDITAQIQDGFYEIKSVNTNLILNIEYVQKKYRLLVDIQGADEMKINGEYVTDGSYIIMNSGLNRIQIISEYYFIKEVLLDNKIVYSNISDESLSNSSYVSFQESIKSDKKLTIITKLRDKRVVDLTLDESGTLASHLSEEDMMLITDLNIKGKMDQRDFVVVNQMQSLFRLNLHSVTIEKYSIYPANTIPEKAFYNNKNIQTIYLSTSIDAIDKQAFLGSMIFSTISFADNLTKIGEEAFKDCQNLIETPYISNISIIEKGVFENCINLTSLNVILSYLIEVKEAAFRNCKNLSITLESDLERIGDYAFENVKSVRWNEYEKFKLSHIGTNALKGCQNCSFDFKNVPYLKELPCFEGYTNINSITLPPNVKEIPEGTFKGCTSLQYVTMNEKIERIAENAFSDSRMTELYVPVNKTPEVYANSFNDFTYSTAKLFVPTDQLPHYRNHPVWGKFKSIEPQGTATYRQFEVLLSKGGRVEVNKTYFGDNDFWLMANTLLFLTSSCMEVYILPDEGYSIESVRLNGENITNALDENNTYVIPYLLVDSQFEVKFKKDNTTSSEMINTDKRVYLSGTNQLSLSGFRIGAHVFVYDTSGRLVIQTIIRDHIEKIGLPGRGIYFIRIDNESVKIIF